MYDFFQSFLYYLCKTRQKAGNIMKTTKTTEKPKKKTVKAKVKKKSKLTLFWEKIPENRFDYIDMKAILK